MIKQPFVQKGQLQLWTNLMLWLYCELGPVQVESYKKLNSFPMRKLSFRWMLYLACSVKPVYVRHVNLQQMWEHVWNCHHWVSNIIIQGYHLHYATILLFISKQMNKSSHVIPNLLIWTHRCAPCYREVIRKRWLQLEVMTPPCWMSGWLKNWVI